VVPALDGMSIVNSLNSATSNGTASFGISNYGPDFSGNGGNGLMIIHEEAVEESKKSKGNKSSRVVKSSPMGPDASYKSNL